MSDAKDGGRGFRIMPYAPGYGVVIWYGESHKDEKALHLTDEEFISLDEAIHKHANEIRARVVADWMLSARSKGDGK